MSESGSRWQAEFNALPEWAQKMVRALSRQHQHGFGDPSQCPALSHNKEKGRTAHYVVLPDECGDDWFDGFYGALALAGAITAPWPPPSPAPHESMTTDNVVEMIAGGDCAFDQPCHFGHRVEYHAVYCHNDAWPNAPRKCRRNRDDFRHEDCPGFVANSAWLETEHLEAGDGRQEG